MAQRQGYGRAADKVPHYAPPEFTVVTAWVLGGVIGLSIVVLLAITIGS